MKDHLKNLISRFCSPIVWASLGSVILWSLKSSGKLEVFGMDADSFNMGWNLIVGLLISVGIINNPSDRGNF